jgi:hypothetical protein
MTRVVRDTITRRRGATNAEQRAHTVTRAQSADVHSPYREMVLLAVIRARRAHENDASSTPSKT